MDETVQSWTTKTTAPPSSFFSLLSVINVQCLTRSVIYATYLFTNIYATHYLPSIYATLSKEEWSQANQSVNNSSFLPSVIQRKRNKSI